MTAKLLFFIMTLTSTSAVAQSSYPQMANQVANRIEAGIKQCGLQIVYPNFNTGRYPQRNAEYLVQTNDGRALAYLVKSYNGAPSLTWMNPNGTFSHSILYDNDAIKFRTPYQGNVASSNRYFTPGGTGYNFYCRRFGNVHFPAFKSCVERDFSLVILQQLCRFTSFN